MMVSGSGVRQVSGFLLCGFSGFRKLSFSISSRSPGDLATASLVGVAARVGPDKLQPWKALANLVENQGCAIAVGYASGVDDHAQRQAFDVDEGVDFAPLHLLAGVITHCVFFTPARDSPFSAAFSDWLSMIAAVGLASRS